MIKCSQKVTAITGKFVTPHPYSYTQSFTGTVWIKDGIISKIDRHSLKRSAVPKDVSNADYHIYLDESNVVYPGLADLHTHYDYNLIPIWIQSGKPADFGWDNRFQWRACDAYEKAIKEKFFKLSDKWNKKLTKGDNTVGDLFLYFSEIQAIAGGTTLLQEPDTIDVSTNPCGDNDDDFKGELKYSFFDADSNDTVSRSHLLLRSTGCIEDLGIKNATNSKIYSEIQFFYPEELKKNGEKFDSSKIMPHQDTSSLTLKQEKSYENFISALSGDDNSPNPKPYSYLVHLGEGKSGYHNIFGWQADKYSRKEFEQLKSDVQSICVGSKKSNLKKLRLGIIHGCSIDFSNNEDLDFIEDNLISIIWSPVSNLILYRDTPGFYNELYKKHRLEGVNLCLGSDWSPSGSKYVWDEGKFAVSLINHMGKAGSLRETQNDVFKMMTVNPAKFLGSKTGQISEGMFADFFVVGKEKEYASDASNDINPDLTPFFDKSVTDAKTKLVIIGGNVIFGEKEFFEKTNTPCQSMHAAECCKYDKWVYVPDELNLDIAEEIKNIKNLIPNLNFSKFMACDDDIYKRQIEFLRRLYTK